MTTISKPALEPGNYTKYKVLAAVLGVIIPVAVAILYYFPNTFRVEGAQVKSLPAVNAVLNSLTAVLLVAGYYFIRRKNVVWHRTMMGLAFLMGSIFLVSYVTYHSQVPSTKFGGEGLIRGVYYFILLTHILLAAATVGLVLFTLYFALTQQFDKHRRIARWTFPVWLYVSVTGVIVYFMIAPYYTY
jgi:putative membrane protein